MIGAVVTITAIALLWLYGSEGSSWDAALERVGPWIVMVLAVYPVVWVWKFIKAPVQIDSELRDRIKTLEERLHPKLEFTWRPNDNKYFDVFDLDQRDDEVIAIGRTAVKNLSEIESVHGVEVRLINFKNDVDDLVTSMDRHLLNNSNSQPSVSLHARSEANFNLFQVAGIPNQAVYLGPFVGGERVALPPGRYRIKVTASADNMKREDALFFLAFNKEVHSLRYRLLSPGNASDEDVVGWGRVDPT